MAYTFIFFFGLTVSYDFDGWFWGLDFFFFGLLGAPVALLVFGFGSSLFLALLPDA